MPNTASDTSRVPDEAASEIAANELLRRHERDEPEANITSAVRDFLIATKLARADEIVEENPPSPDSTRRAVDLTALDTFVESKRRIGMERRGVPEQEYINQLDGYLESSQRNGKVRMGILTDGKYWVLRWPGAGEPKLTKPYAITLEDANSWRALHEWLRDDALVALENITPTREDIEARFGPSSPRYEQDVDTLRALYEKARDNPSIQLKRRLWQILLRTALGEIAQDDASMDDLFVRHTYLTTVIGIVVQASFGIDIRQLAANDPHDLVLGQRFRSDTGIEGVVESDFFAWPTEIGGGPFLSALARRISRFDWLAAPENVAAILYETVIPPDEREQLGEYYTPDWLAHAMVREVVTEPLNQSVLDPACGSGTFLAEAITHFIKAADNNPDPRDTYTASQRLDQLRDKVIGIDVHPVAVHLARAAWVLAAKPLFDRIRDEDGERPSSNFSAPVYLGDSLQLGYSMGDLLPDENVPVQVRDRENTELLFPVSLVDRAENFDRIMADITDAIENGDDPQYVLDDSGLFGPEREVLAETVKKLQRLHSEGRDHIWAYYTRNMVRPVALARQKVDVIIGNPPWINYNKTISDLRRGLERLSKNTYAIWVGGQYATQQDVAGLFYARSVDLYLKNAGLISMVLPLTALQSGQFRKWRSGHWKAVRDGAVLSVDFSVKRAWDLEQLEPNNFFPVPACVVFAQRVGIDVMAQPLAGEVDRWIGKAGADDVSMETVEIVDIAQNRQSPYEVLSRVGAILHPRSLVFVTETENRTVIAASGTVTVNPYRSPKGKAPWKNLDLTELTEQTIETNHVYDVHYGETLVPFGTLNPMKAVLPVKQSESTISFEARSEGGVKPSAMNQRMRGRWRTVSQIWEANKAAANKLNAIGQFDYWRHLSAQLDWREDAGERPVRMVYGQSGQPTAALVQDKRTIVDYTLLWVKLRSVAEGHYLMSIVNSDFLYQKLQPLMPKGQFGPRHVQKHLWKLPIPAYDEGVALHKDLAKAGEVAAERVADMLPELRAREEAEGRSLTVTTARREIRKWLKTSKEGKDVERLVGKLLRG